MAVLKQVNPDQMRDYAQQLDDLIKEWITEVNDITFGVRDLNEMWDGLANDEFNERWQNDLDYKYKKLGDVMIEYKKAIETAATKYEQYESEIAKIVES